MISRVKVGDVDVHPTKPALVINYTIETYTDSKITDKKQAQKTIPIHISSRTNLAHYADEIITSSSVLSSSHKPHVEQVLYYIQRRDFRPLTAASAQQSPVSSGSMNWVNTSNRNGPAPAYSRNGWYDDDEEGGQNGETGSGNRLDQSPHETIDVAVSMDKIDEYVEKMYEDVGEKIKGAKMILGLAKNVVNLPGLIQNESLMSALSRVLVEDGKRSMELVTTILSIFFCFSNYTEFHGLITQCKVGDASLKAIERELERFSLWQSEILKLQESLQKSALTSNGSGDGVAKNQRQELDDKIKKMKVMVRKQDHLLFITFHLLLNLAEDLSIEVKMRKRNIIHLLMNVMEVQRSRSSLLESSGKKSKSPPSAYHPNPDLTIVILSFLKKLSIFKENKNDMVSEGKRLIETIAPFLVHENEQVVHMTLQLFQNLCQDETFRGLMVEEKGMISTLVKILSNAFEKNIEISKTVIIVLYELSADDKAKSVMTYTELIPTLMKMVLTAETQSIEVMALLINLAHNSRNAEIICGEADGGTPAGSGLKFLMKRALKNRDPLLWKFLRTMACTDNQNVKGLFLPYTDDIMKLLIKMNTVVITNTSSKMQEFSDAAAIVVELLGIVSGLQGGGIDYAHLIEVYNLLDFLAQRFLATLSLAQSSKTKTTKASGSPLPPTINQDDDILLECLVLSSALAQDRTVATVISSHRLVAPSSLLPHHATTTSLITLIHLLSDILTVKQEDDECVLHTLNAFHYFLQSDSTRSLVLTEMPYVVTYMMDLVYDRHPDIRHTCDMCLDIIIEVDGERWRDKVQAQRFLWHNAEWLEAMRGRLEGGEYDEESDNDEEHVRHAYMHLKQSIETSCN